MRTCYYTVVRITMSNKVYLFYINYISIRDMEIFMGDLFVVLPQCCGSGSSRVRTFGTGFGSGSETTKNDTFRTFFGAEKH
jgi:hypothetical protein